MKGNVSNLISTLPLANKTILITGCNGFLGQHLMRTLCTLFDHLEEAGDSANHYIFAIDNGITSSATSTVERNYISYFNDNAIFFDYSRLKHVDIVFHLAGLASPAQYKKYPLETIDVAVDLTRTLLKLSLHWKARFIYFSSSEIYGNPSQDSVPTPETYKGYVSSIGPRSCYDESKRMGETLCYVFNNYYDLHTVIIRPFNIYGPGMSKYDYRMVPNMVRSIIESQPIKIYGDGLQTRTFCFVEDSIEGIIKAAFEGYSGEAYNIGCSHPEISMIDLANLMKTVVNQSITVDLIDYPDNYPADEPLRRCPDTSKAKNHFGFEASTTLSAGLLKTFEWALHAYS
jgi:UDP-glucuronate decarboxylase